MQWETRSGITNIRGWGVALTGREETFGGTTGMKDIVKSGESGVSKENCGVPSTIQKKRCGLYTLLEVRAVEHHHHIRPGCGEGAGRISSEQAKLGL